MPKEEGTLNVRARISPLSAALTMVLAFVMVSASTERTALAGPPAEAGSESPKRDDLELVANSAMVRVEVVSSLNEADFIALWVRDEAQKLLDDRGISPDDTERRLVVRVTGTDQDRELELRVVEDGKVVGASESPSSCECITRSELMTAVRKRVEARIPDLVAKTPENGTSTPILTGDGKPPGGEPDRHPKKLHALGKAGIGVLVAGTALTAVGIGLAVRGTNEIDDEFGLSDLRTPGFVCLGVGLGVAVAGATMLAVDLGRSRRARARATATPTVGQRFVGISVSGRF